LKAPGVDGDGDGDDFTRTVRATRSPVSDDTTAVYRLSLTRGPNAGDVHIVDAAAGVPPLVGTSAACTIQLRDPEVSRRHASLDVHEGRLRVRDLGSANGTFVNGIRVVEALLGGGEDIQLGTSAIHVERETEAKPAVVSDETSFGAVVGASFAMRRLYPICHRLARSDVPLVIEGETGTGKEVMAEAIHALSPRGSGGPFVVFDCAAAPASLIESALFGYEKGAFTGAVTSRPGVFEEADGGTLLIDEIGDLDTALQSRLLRAIQKSEIRRLGGAKWIHCDVRVIAATRRDLDKEVQAGRFRDDLFFRLAVARIVLPPLRERKEDIETLARHFWLLSGGVEDQFPPHVLERFAIHPWPGNVRELANTVARLVALGELVESNALFLQSQTTGGAASSSAPEGDGNFISKVVAQNLTLAEAREQVVREFERQYVAHLLEQHGGDAARAAAASGIGERYLRTIRARARSR
jgi:transcriptional regulator with GAF, ATPase, and Fis domain